MSSGYAVVQGASVSIAPVDVGVSPVGPVPMPAVAQYIMAVGGVPTIMFGFLMTLKGTPAGSQVPCCVGSPFPGSMSGTSMGPVMEKSASAALLVGGMPQNHAMIPPTLNMTNAQSGPPVPPGQTGTFVAR